MAISFAQLRTNTGMLFFAWQLKKVSSGQLRVYNPETPIPETNAPGYRPGQELFNYLAEGEEIDWYTSSPTLLLPRLIYPDKTAAMKARNAQRPRILIRPVLHKLKMKPF